MRQIILYIRIRIYFLFSGKRDTNQYDKNYMPFGKYWLDCHSIWNVEFILMKFIFLSLASASLIVIYIFGDIEMFTYCLAGGVIGLFLSKRY